MGLKAQPTFVETRKRRGSWQPWAWNRGVAGLVRATGTTGSAAPGRDTELAMSGGEDAAVTGMSLARNFSWKDS